MTGSDSSGEALCTPDILRHSLGTLIILPSQLYSILVSSNTVYKESKYSEQEGGGRGSYLNERQNRKDHILSARKHTQQQSIPKHNTYNFGFICLCWPEGAGNWQDSLVTQADPLQSNSISHVTRWKARGRTHAQLAVNIRSELLEGLHEI